MTARSEYDRKFDQYRARMAEFDQAIKKLDLAKRAAKKIAWFPILGAALVLHLTGTLTVGTAVVWAIGAVFLRWLAVVVVDRTYGAKLMRELGI